MQDILAPIMTLALIGFLVFNLWRHIKREFEKDKINDELHKNHLRNQRPRQRRDK